MPNNPVILTEKALEDIRDSIKNQLVRDNQIKITTIPHDHLLDACKYFLTGTVNTIPDEWKYTPIEEHYECIDFINLECMGIKQKQVLIHKLSAMIMNNEIHYIQYKAKDEE